MFYELRRYKVFDGRMDEWVQFMDNEIIPFQRSKGMVITSSFRGEDDLTYRVHCGGSKSVGAMNSWLSVTDSSPCRSRKSAPGIWPLS